MTSYHAWTHLPKEQGGTDPIPVVEGAGGDGVSWASIATVNEILAPFKTWTRVPLTDFATDDGALFSLGTDGITMIGGVYTVFAHLYWGNFDIGGILCPGSPVGRNVEFQGGYHPVIGTTSMGNGISLVFPNHENGASFMSTVCLWAWQNTTTNPGGGVQAELHGRLDIYHHPT